jgi:predicted RNase H-like nuclease
LAETVIGVDGCPGGWIAVIWGRTLAHRLCPTFSDVLALDGRIIAVDMPIGFPEKHGRSFDSEVRKVLGPRRSSVFPVPSRAAVMCEDYRHACSTNRANSDPPKAVGKQCFNLFAKMREIDILLRKAPLQHRVFEAHPEVAFWAMNGRRPVKHPKKQGGRPFKAGIALRRRLLAASGFPLATLPTLAYLKREVAIDDLIDACACAWVARRILRGEHLRFSGEPGTDQYNLRMEINA